MSTNPRDRAKYGSPPMSYDEVLDALIARQQAAKPKPAKRVGLSIGEIERRIERASEFRKAV